MKTMYPISIRTSCKLRGAWELPPELPWMEPSISFHAVSTRTHFFLTTFVFSSQFTRNTPEVSDVLHKYDWVFIPVLNPDGYVFTWYNSSTRNWRKNRSIDPLVKHRPESRTLNDSMINLCVGVDINRNFDVMWGGEKLIICCYDEQKNESKSAILSGLNQDMA